jgi:hypothetical protein
MSNITPNNQIIKKETESDEENMLDELVSLIDDSDFDFEQQEDDSFFFSEEDL